MNKCIITGRLTKAPELKYTPTNKAVCEFTIASNRPVLRDGERQADFVNCQAWGKTAENLAKYQDKGSLIAVFGEYRTDSYNDADGNRRYKTFILVNEIEYLEKKTGDQTPTTADQLQTDAEPLQTAVDPFEEFGQQLYIDENDIPF